MKQAILVTAYKNYDHLNEIINFFDDNFEVFVHIDKKSKISEYELKRLKKNKNLKLITSKFYVNWGGFNHLKAILYLAEQAIINPEHCYLHLISGHDFPVKQKDEFLDFFSKDRDEEFIETFEVPKSGWADNGGMDRLEYYNFFDILNGKNVNHRDWIYKFVNYQKKIGYKRGFSASIPPLHGGATWWSLSRDCVKHVIDFSNRNTKVLERFKYTFCSEEFFFQTIIMNSEFASKVTGRNLRYIDWVPRNGNNPAILDETDYIRIMESEAFFARKFDYPHSIELLNSLKKVLV